MRPFATSCFSAGLALALSACTAMSNPDRDDMLPVAGPIAAVPETKTAPGQVPAVAANESANAPAPQSGPPAPVTSAPAESGAAKPASPTQDAAPRARSLGSIAGRPLLAEDIVARLWTADTRRVRDALEQIVFAELTLQEADRLGVRVDPKLADAAYAKAREAVAKKHAESSSKHTLEEYIERVLEIRPERYFDELRREKLVQLLAARCVRAWTLENDVAEVRLTEVRDAAAVEAAKSDLGAGKTLDAIALSHGHGEDEATHVTSMRLVRSESHELARIVFATPLGIVGGPIDQAGRSLFFVVDRVQAGREGLWPAFAEEVERELSTKPVDNLEFVQWHAAMRRRYRVELTPFFDFVDPQR